MKVGENNRDGHFLRRCVAFLLTAKIGTTCVQSNQVTLHVDTSWEAHRNILFLKLAAFDEIDEMFTNPHSLTHSKNRPRAHFGRRLLTNAMESHLCFLSDPFRHNGKAICHRGVPDL
jgi:hypothetical protein